MSIAHSHFLRTLGLYENIGPVKAILAKSNSKSKISHTYIVATNLRDPVSSRRSVAVEPCESRFNPTR